VGESRSVQLIVQAAPWLLNVSRDDGPRVQALLNARYTEMDADPEWRALASPLSSAFQQMTPSMIVVAPRGVDPRTAPVVCFLHGYGGNGKLFAWLVSRALPQMWVIAPSHGLTWSKPRLGHLDAALGRFEALSGIPSPRYWLVGLSDGGVGAFEIYGARPTRIAGMVSVVGVPRRDAVTRLPQDGRVLMLNGRRDRFVGADTVAERFPTLAARVRHAELEWYDDGHYFLLDDDGKALERIRAFIQARAPQ